MNNKQDNINEATEYFHIDAFFDDVLNNADSIQKTPTFLSTIGKSYYETYLSKILLYVLTKQKGVLARLVNNYAHAKTWENWVDVVEDKAQSTLEIIRARTEMPMNGGRADVFLELKYNNERFTFTVENKCFAEEHNTGDDISQTQTYADCIKFAYRDSKNVFYYLKPDFNPSQATCKDFMTITYSDLEKYLGGYNDSDYIINDFKIHIGEFLHMNNFNDIEKKYLRNYKTINDFINGAEEKRNNLIDSVVKAIKDTIGEAKLEKADNNTVFRFYKDEGWSDYLKDKDKMYYFYTEIKFIDGCLDNIVCQNTVKAYVKDNKNKNIVIKFLQDSKHGYESWGNLWYILEQNSFDSSNDILSKDWIEDLKIWAVGNMEKYYKNMSAIVDEFLEWKNNSNNN